MSANPEKKVSRVKIELHLKPEFAQRFQQLCESHATRDAASLLALMIRQFEQLDGFIREEDGFFVEKLNGERKYISRLSTRH